VHLFKIKLSTKLCG